MFKKITYTLIIIGYALASLASESVSLIWDSSISLDVVGYNVYYGTVSGNCTNRVNVGAATNTTISSLVEGTTYYFAATAYTGSGLESDLSNEASYTTPTNSIPTNTIVRPLPVITLRLIK